MDAQTLVMMTQIAATLIILSVFSALLAFLNYFLNFCFQRGNVFDFYLPWLAKQICKRFYPLKYKNIMQITDEYKRQATFIEIVETHGFYKMFGGCPICFNVWVGMVLFPLLVIFTGIHWLYFFPFILIANFLLRKITGIE